jgi:hypothetical protein
MKNLENSVFPSLFFKKNSILPYFYAFPPFDWKKKKKMNTKVTCLTFHYFTLSSRHLLWMNYHQLLKAYRRNQRPKNWFNTDQRNFLKKKKKKKATWEEPPPPPPPWPWSSAKRLALICASSSSSIVFYEKKKVWKKKSGYNQTKLYELRHSFPWPINTKCQITGAPFFFSYYARSWNVISKRGKFVDPFHQLLLNHLKKSYLRFFEKKKRLLSLLSFCFYTTKHEIWRLLEGKQFTVLEIWLHQLWSTKRVH